MRNMASITKQGSQTPIINAVRGDQNTRAFTFVVERYDGKTDLAELVWVLQTKNAAGMTDATALYAYKTDENVQLTWTIGGFATEAEGRTSLQLMGFDVDQTVQWSSGTYYMEVSRAISPDKSQTGATGQLKELVLAAAVRADEAAEGAKAAGEEAINIVRTEYERMQADVDAIKPIAVMQRTPMFPKQKVDGYIYNVLDNSTFGNGESYRGYAIYDVQAGETYLISGSSSANAEAYPLGAFWHDYSDWAFSFFGTDATKVYTDLVVTAPENATKMVVNLNSAYGVLKVDKQINLTQRLDIVMEQDYSARTLDGVITEAKKNPFAFKEYDKGYISFVFDDLPAEIDEIASIFEEYGMPLCLAAIPERLGYACEGLTKNVGSFEPGMSRGEVCAQVVNNGGEVLAHNSDVITAENQHVHEVMYNHFVKTKETLAAQGWPIRGIIRSGGEDQINKSAVIERWVTGNYEYSNYGYAPQHNLERETINQSMADLKAKILKAVNEKSWLRIMAHDYAFGGGTTFTGAADLRAILDYCKSVGIAVVTYAHMVDTFGCSELGKRLTAVEASAQQANEAARNAQTAADNAATEATKIATQAGQQAKETANKAVADLEEFKAGIEDEVSQLSEEIDDIKETVGIDDRSPITVIAEWQTGYLAYVDTSGNLTIKDREEAKYIRIDNIELYKSFDTTMAYPAFDRHPEMWLVVVCDADGKRVYPANQAVITYAQRDTTRDGWYSVDAEGMHINIQALLEALPDSGVIYLSKWDADGFDWTYTTGADGLVQKVAAIEAAVEDTKVQVDLMARIPEVLLPARAIAVVGHEFNLYFDNIIVGKRSGIDVVASVAPAGITYRNLGDCLRFIPTAENIGSYTITVSIYNMESRKIISSAACELKIIEDTALSGKTVLFIGDSLTDAGIYPAEIQHNLSQGGIVSLGTREDTVSIGGQSLTVRHEGRAGWASYDYTRTGGSYREDVENAFWDGTAFNFGWYMEQQGYSSVDIVCINLGTNGAANTNNRTTDAIDMMIASIHAYDPNIMVLVSLIAPPASQEGWGMRVAGTGTAGQFRAQEVALIKEYKTRYEQKENVDVTEVYIALDCVHDYPTKTEAVSARNPTQIVRQNNNVHPSAYGYLKFADVYYNNILYQLTK